MKLLLVTLAVLLGTATGQLNNPSFEGNWQVSTSTFQPFSYNYNLAGWTLANAGSGGGFIIGTNDGTHSWAGGAYDGSYFIDLRNAVIEGNLFTTAGTSYTISLRAKNRADSNYINGALRVSVDDDVKLDLSVSDLFTTEWTLYSFSFTASSYSHTLKLENPEGNKITLIDDIKVVIADPCAGVVCPSCSICSSGTCIADSAAIGSACDDLDSSTSNDVCTASGVCQGQTGCTSTDCGVFQRHGLCSDSTNVCECHYPWGGNNCDDKTSSC